MTSDCKIEIVTRFDTYYFSIEYKQNVFLKYLATKAIESKKLPFYSIAQNTGRHLMFKTVRGATNINC